MSALKWPLFAFAIICTMMSGGDHNSIGGAAAGMWIAFALFHVQDRREAMAERARILKSAD